MIYNYRFIPTKPVVEYLEWIRDTMLTGDYTEGDVKCAVAHINGIIRVMKKETGDTDKKLEFTKETEDDFNKYKELRII